MHILIAAESTGGLAALGLNWTSLLFQLINFGVLFFVLQRYVFPPIVRLLERRRQQIDAGLQDAEAAKQARLQAETERQKILEAARKEGSALVEAARSEAKKEAARIVEEARAAADAKVSGAEQRIARTSAQAREELMQELGGVVAAATAAVTRDAVTPKTDEEVIKRSLQQVSR